MPAGSVLFTNACVPKFEFGKHHRNTIKWSPLSRFICLAGIFYIQIFTIIHNSRLWKSKWRNGNVGCDFIKTGWSLQSIYN